MKKRETVVHKNKHTESGQAIVEYVLLLSIVLGIMVYFMNTLTGSFDDSTARFGGKIEKQIRTGSAPASVWTK